MRRLVAKSHITAMNQTLTPAMSVTLKCGDEIKVNGKNHLSFSSSSTHQLISYRPRLLCATLEYSRYHSLLSCPRHGIPAARRPCQQRKLQTYFLRSRSSCLVLSSSGWERSSGRRLPTSSFCYIFRSRRYQSSAGEMLCST